MPSDLFAIVDGAAPAAPFLVVTLAVDPRGWARPRARMVRGPKPFIQFYKDADTRAFEDALAMQAKVEMRRRGLKMVEGPLAVRVFAMMPIPVSWPKRDRDAALVGTKLPAAKPDFDNFAKMVDAFNGVVWVDDAQVVRALVVKEYAEKPGLIVEVYTLP